SRALRACVFRQNVSWSGILLWLALRSFVGRSQTTASTRVERLAADRVPALPLIWASKRPRRPCGLSFFTGDQGLPARGHAPRSYCACIHRRRAARSYPRPSRNTGSWRRDTVSMCFAWLVIVQSASVPTPLGTAYEVFSLA